MLQQSLHASDDGAPSPPISRKGRGNFFTFVPHNGRRRPGMTPTGVSKEKAMKHHRSLLPRIVVTLIIKIKLTIRRR
jgi:hypothetical protein